MNKLPKLVCENVWKLYGDKPKEFLHQHNNNPDQETIKKAGYIQAIRDASLEVYENEILVVMGLSGSGKSTLVRCMSRLVDPTIGEIFFENTGLVHALQRGLLPDEPPVGLDLVLDGPDGLALDLQRHLLLRQSGSRQCHIAGYMTS